MYRPNIFYLRIFFQKQNICTTFKPVMLVIYHKIAVDVIDSTMPDEIEDIVFQISLFFSTVF